MFKFLMGVAFGAAGYWAWQSFGRDLLGMGGDQDTSYGGFNSGSASSTFGGSTGTGGSTPMADSSTTPATSSSTTIPAGSATTPASEP